MSTNKDYTEGYCMTLENDFQKVYLQYHAYISVIICIFGCTVNAINIVVFSRKQMASPINSVLIGLAVADLLIMMEYIPFALHNYTNTISSDVNKRDYGWTVFVYFHLVFSQIVHSIAVWLTITLAVLRYIAINYPLKSRKLCSKKNTNIVISMAFAFCPVLCLPIFFATTIDEHVQYVFISGEKFIEKTYTLILTKNKTLLTATFWIYSVIMKLVPCVILSILSILLIIAMKSSDRKRRKLFNDAAITNKGEKTEQNCSGNTCSDGNNSTDRTTRMLIVLLGLFLVTEFPQAVLGLLTAIAPNLFERCYFALGEMMDLAALIGCAVNFLLYCSMSRQFRRMFTKLIRKMLLFKEVPLRQTFTRRNFTGPTCTTIA